MIDSDIPPKITVLTCRVNVAFLSTEKYWNFACLFTKWNIGKLLTMAIDNNQPEESFHITKLVLNLGTISSVHFSTIFNQRLAQAFEQFLQQLSTRAHTQIQRLTHATSTELLANVESHPKALNTLAICCLQQATLLQLLQNRQPQYLQMLLKRLLQRKDQLSSVLGTCYNRVTVSRLGIAALGYLLHQAQGHEWLSQHAPTASQVTGWTTAIDQGEIPPDQVVQLLTGNRNCDSILLGQPAYPPLLVMRWLLPLWRQPEVRKVIHRLKGGRGVQRLDAYLSRCLQWQDDYAMPKQLGGHTVLSRDNTTLPEREEGHAVQDHARLPQGEEMAVSPRSAIQLRKGGERSPNEPLSSSQGISNAGLLLLWPLLPQLFSQLGLLEKERFVSDASRGQAVYGLDRLVWGEVNPTEGRLMLNQVLCGVSSSTTVPPPTPLSLLQLQQIDDWLAAIGQQLPGWQKLSLTDIRQLFLQRAGEISTEGAVTKISVWPEPYDFLLRDWPWPMTLASFPWTEQPLTIIWPLNDFTG